VAAHLRAPGRDDRPAAPPASRHVRRRGFVSPLTLRILAINLLALALLVGGLLYLDVYREGLVEAKFRALRIEGELIAGALAESAVVGLPTDRRLDPLIARQIVRRLVVPTGVRARLYADDGELIADSRRLAAAGRSVVTKTLPPPEPGSAFNELVARLYDLVTGWLPRTDQLPPYVERSRQRAEDYAEVVAALRGEAGSGRRAAPGEGTILSFAVPVQSFKRVQGALLLSTDSRDIEDSVRSARLGILGVFVIAVVVTVLLSAFLAGTIARPVRRLAEAADQVRRVTGRQIEIPDFTKRRDEIGDLSGALRDMTQGLYQRLDDIEAFAADVAHELKNPLTSLRSAIETVRRVDDPAQQKRLMDILLDDVIRLDRLISDISDASRLDAELSRGETAPVDVSALARALGELYRETAKPGAPELVLDLPEDGSLTVPGIERRLGQVITNLVDNAVSFSPPGGVIRLSAERRDGAVELRVEDDGPGLPEDKIEAVFERFYSQRPVGEDFGIHSGLGLSISRQIVEAHGGSIRAENRRDGNGRVVGARFIVRLPI